MIFKKRAVFAKLKTVENQREHREHKNNQITPSRIFIILAAAIIRTPINVSLFKCGWESNILQLRDFNQFFWQKCYSEMYTWNVRRKLKTFARILGCGDEILSSLEITLEMFWQFFSSKARVFSQFLSYGVVCKKIVLLSFASYFAWSFLKWLDTNFKHFDHDTLQENHGERV